MSFRGNKEKNVLKYLIVVLIIAVLVLSFVPCIRVTRSSGPWDPVQKQTTHNTGFQPMFCLIVTIIELLLLFTSNRTWSKVIRFILNLIKISFPILFFDFQDKFDEIAYDIGSITVQLGWAVYVIVGIGIVIGAVEIIDIICTAKEKAMAASE